MSTLTDIAPQTKQRLIDLVRAAGVDVADWDNIKGAKANAARNPKYCYEWAFVEPKKVAVLNLWHNLMNERLDGGVFIEFNYRWFASQRTGIERVRALRADEAIQVAVKDTLPIRVVVLAGRRRNIDNPAEKPSHVSKRMLDPAAWAITAYDWNTGAWTMTRGPGQFVDQFSIQQASAQTPERRDVSGQAFVRSSIVRSNVLLRANGRCEWCGESGFVMADGRMYLETHHVIPLSEDGPDTERNVSALCPNHHRESHHGKNKNDIRKGLLERLKRLLR
jgi:5-methylcytosine-specific restriction protein A